MDTDRHLSERPRRQCARDCLSSPQASGLFFRSVAGDTIDHRAANPSAWEHVYLDPMFPLQHRASAFDRRPDRSRIVTNQRRAQGGAISILIDMLNQIGTAAIVPFRREPSTDEPKRLSGCRTGMVSAGGNINPDPLPRL